MSKGFVLLGDKTTHGGEVISASSTMTVNGNKVALVGDEIFALSRGMVSMPLSKDHQNGSLMGNLLLWMAANVNVAAMLSPVRRIVQ
jgi:hypothetical protein